MLNDELNVEFNLQYVARVYSLNNKKLKNWKTSSKTFAYTSVVVEPDEPTLILQRIYLWKLSFSTQSLADAP